MPANAFIQRLSNQERLNFLLTNRIPRRWVTIFMGWCARIENPVVRKLSIAVWQAFADDLRLHEARKTEFTSLHDCFIRELKEGARTVDPDPTVLTSPCDAIVGASGAIAGTEVFQAKGFPYTLEDLVQDRRLVERYRDGVFVTLRLKSSMYHRFHAPLNCHVSEVNYISGDTWNVNPVALKRVEKLFCKNERAVIDLHIDEPDQAVTLVPVAAILVASMCIHGLPDVIDLKYRGPNRIPCDARFDKGQEMGYFQHGSTIIVLASKGFRLCDDVREGQLIRMGQPLLKRPGSAP